MGDIEYKCRYMDDNGLCRGRYYGFKCIGELCEDWGRYMVSKSNLCHFCVYFKDGYCEYKKALITEDIYECGFFKLR